MKISQSSWEATTAAHESPSPFLVITPPPAAAEVVEGLFCRCGTIDYRRGRFCAHIHRRRRRSMPTCIWHARSPTPQVVGSNYAVHHGLSQLSSGGGGGGKGRDLRAAINQIGNGQTLRAKRGGGPSCTSIEEGRKQCERRRSRTPNNANSGRSTRTRSSRRHIR